MLFGYKNHFSDDGCWESTFLFFIFLNRPEPLHQSQVRRDNSIGRQRLSLVHCLLHDDGAAVVLRHDDATPSTNLSVTIKPSDQQNLPMDGVQIDLLPCTVNLPSRMLSCDGATIPEKRLVCTADFLSDSPHIDCVENSPVNAILDSPQVVDGIKNSARQLASNHRRALTETTPPSDSVAVPKDFAPSVDTPT